LAPDTGYLRLVINTQIVCDACDVQGQFDVMVGIPQDKTVVAPPICGKKYDINKDSRITESDANIIAQDLINYDVIVEDAAMAGEHVLTDADADYCLSIEFYCASGATDQPNIDCTKCDKPNQNTGEIDSVVSSTDALFIKAVVLRDDVNNNFRVNQEDANLVRDAAAAGCVIE